MLVNWSNWWQFKWLCFMFLLIISSHINDTHFPSLSINYCHWQFDIKPTLGAESSNNLSRPEVEYFLSSPSLRNYIQLYPLILWWIQFERCPWLVNQLKRICWYIIESTVVSSLVSWGMYHKRHTVFYKSLMKCIWKSQSPNRMDYLITRQLWSAEIEKGKHTAEDSKTHSWFVSDGFLSDMRCVWMRRMNATTTCI